MDYWVNGCLNMIQQCINTSNSNMKGKVKFSLLAAGGAVKTLAVVCFVLQRHLLFTEGDGESMTAVGIVTERKRGNPVLNEFKDF